MNEWQIMFTAVFAVFAVIGVGVAVRRLQWLSPQVDQPLLRLVIRVLIPALIVHAILGDERLEAFENLTWPPAIGFLSVACGFAIAALIGWMFRGVLGLSTGTHVRTFALSVGLYNYGYVPIPLVEELFGTGSLGVLFVHNLGVEVALWTLGIMLISGRFDRHWWRHLLNPPIVAIIVALLMNFMGWHAFVPAFVLKAVQMLAVCAVPVSLILIGATIADQMKEAHLFTGGRVIAAGVLLRLGLLPAAFVLVAWLAPVSTELKQVVVVQAGMPGAVFPIMLARIYGGDVRTAMRVALGTGVFSLVTMPLWLWGGMSFLGLSVGGP